MVFVEPIGTPSTFGIFVYVMSIELAESSDLGWANILLEKE